jgi:DnaK suppressor protein
MDDETARELLATERARIEHELDNLHGAVKRAAERGAEVQDSADHARIDYGQAQDLGRIEALEAELAAVERAEKRLEEGTYGLSIESGEPISEGRLRRLPASERTTEEQIAFERRGGA